MSTCVSRYGEFGDHAVGDDWYCPRCGVFDADGVLAALAYADERIAVIQAERDEYAACSRSNSRSSLAMFEVIGDVPEVRAARAKLDADPYSQDGTDFGSIVSAYVTRLRAELARAQEVDDRLSAELHGGPESTGGPYGWIGRAIEAEAALQGGMVPKNWHGLMEILDDIYPESIFPTAPDREDRDLGLRIISLLRQLNEGRERVT
jgi:hypothetical protein